MQIGTLLESYKLPTKKTRKLTDRQLLLDEILTTLNIDKKYARGIHFTAKNLTNPEIRELFDQARKWTKNPAALFRKLLKEKAEHWKLLLDNNVRPGCKCDYCDYYKEKLFKTVNHT